MPPRRLLDMAPHAPLLPPGSDRGRWRRAHAAPRVWVLAMLGAAACLTEGVEPAPVAASLVGGRPLLGLADKCLDVRGRVAADGASLVMWSCGGQASQRWAPVGSTIRGLGDRCVTVDPSAAGIRWGQGRRVELRTCTGAATQQWTVRVDGTIAGYEGKCLDVAGASTADDTIAVVWPCLGGANQRWRFAAGARPFGTHGGYVTAGVRQPTGATPATLDQVTLAFYRQWKAAHLVPGCVAGTYRVNNAASGQPIRVSSEGQGYGMLVAALMAGADPDAQLIFDGLYRYVSSHGVAAQPSLMAWAQDAACHTAPGATTATDADLDIAYALLLADRQWGSAGAIDYHGAALRMLAAILATDVHPAGSLLIGGPLPATDRHYDGTRTSDVMPGHLKAFAAATGSARWIAISDRAYATLSALQAGYAPATGLVPDFAVGASGAAPRPAPPAWLEGPNDGHYSWNACRVPLRLATDYLLSGDARARAVIQRLNAGIRRATADVPARLRTGYTLDGVGYGGGAVMAFLAPLAVAAMIEPAVGTNQPWLDAAWAAVVQQPPTDYYSDSLKLMAMLVVSGNWWTP